MRLLKTLPLLLLALLPGACKKNNTVVNYSYTVNGSTITGNAVASYDPLAANFEILMNGPNNSYVALVWFGIDSQAAIHTIVPKTYVMPHYALPPYNLLATFESQYQANQYVNSFGGGSITITTNTGPGGLISGTFNFIAFNSNTSYDSVVVTNGSFTNVAD